MDAKTAPIISGRLIGAPDELAPATSRELVMLRESLLSVPSAGKLLLLRDPAGERSSSTGSAAALAALAAAIAASLAVLSALDTALGAPTDPTA